MRIGARNLKRHCRICAKKTLQVPGLRSPVTLSTPIWAEISALARLRARLRKYGLRLMLDFVPNHTGLDHPWVEDHPEYYIPGSEERSDQIAPKLHSDPAQTGRPYSGSWTGSLLFRLA